MLKLALSQKGNLRIDKYPKLTAFLKKKSIGYKPNESSVFWREDIKRFICDAS